MDNLIPYDNCMNDLGDITMRSSLKKDKVITLRCSDKEREQLESKAKNLGKSVSSYVLDCSIAGLERKKDKDKKRIKQMIQITEICNQIYKRLKDSDADIPEDIKCMIDLLMKGAEQLWQF